MPKAPVIHVNDYEPPPPSVPRNLVERFDQSVEAYVDHLKSPLGRLRLETTWAHLRARLPAPPFDVIDVGCGSADLALRLANEGAVVALLDPSKAMLGEARARANRELNRDARKRVHYVEGTLDDVLRDWKDRRFGVVLCHCTMEYLPEDDAVWRGLASLVAPGGLVSVVVPNRFSATVGLAIRGLVPRALDALQAAHGEPDMTFKLRRRMYDPAGLIMKMQTVGLEPQAVRGVRVFADLMPQQVLEADFASALQLEVAAGAHDSYVGISRYLHVLGRPVGDGEPPTRRFVTR